MKRMKSMKGLQTHTQKERAREGGISLTVVLMPFCTFPAK